MGKDCVTDVTSKVRTTGSLAPTRRALAGGPAQAEAVRPLFRRPREAPSSPEGAPRLRLSSRTDHSAFPSSQRCLLVQNEAQQNSVVLPVTAGREGDEEEKITKCQRKSDCQCWLSQL